MQKINWEKKEAVLFDFEGTLVDFQWDLSGAVRETLNLLRASGFDAKKFTGLKYSALMLEAQARAAEAGRTPQEVREAIGRVYDRFDEDALGRWSLRPKAEVLLSALKTAEIQTGLVSNIGKKTLPKALSKLKLATFFNVLVTRDHVQNLKPNPEGIFLALDRLRVSKEKALFIGDSLDDLQAAQNAGIEAFMILGGENQPVELQAAQAGALIHGFDELLEHFMNHSG